MKHNKLRSIGHNVADSLASGISFVIGRYDIPDVFAEARACPEGFISVNFLEGTASVCASESLSRAASSFAAELPDFCAKHDVAMSDFRELTARYSNEGLERRTVVTISDRNGRQTKDEYIGTPLRHIKILDSLGRIRTKRAESKSSE
ncbi:MAG: hypothetical protein JNM12_07170 [Alphaproteobacteria bacterium]|nr:hypothetical protein [Alphaproteobacteria bacterium]